MSSAVSLIAAAGCTSRLLQAGAATGRGGVLGGAVRLREARGIRGLMLLSQAARRRASSSQGAGVVVLRLLLRFVGG